MPHQASRDVLLECSPLAVVLTNQRRQCDAMQSPLKTQWHLRKFSLSCNPSMHLKSAEPRPSLFLQFINSTFHTTHLRRTADNQWGQSEKGKKKRTGHKGLPLCCIPTLSSPSFHQGLTLRLLQAPLMGFWGGWDVWRGKGPVAAEGLSRMISQEQDSFLGICAHFLCKRDQGMRLSLL